MTLEELERTLPNGLHDAEIKSVLVDYSRHRVTIELSAWVGDMDPVVAPREAYRDGTLVLEGLQFLVMEEPDPKYKFAVTESLWIDTTHDEKHLKIKARSQVPKDCFVSGIFVQEWNSYIYVAAREASLDWTSEMYDKENPESRGEP